MPKRRRFKKHYLYILILNILSLVLFFKIVEDVIKKELAIRLDVFINGFALESSVK